MKTLKGIFTLLTGLVFMASPVFAQDTWKVDNAHSKVTFSTVHNTISDVDGLFNSFDASVVASEKDFSDAVFTLNIETNSIDTEVEMRDNHLKSEDFFHVSEYPEITFESTSIKETAKKNHYQLKGEITIRGITKPITLDMWYRGTIENDKGQKIAGFQITGTINRLDFNVGTDFPETLISNEVFLEADAEFIKQ